MNHQLAQPLSLSSWFAVLRGHARNHALIASGLGIATLALLALLIQSMALALMEGAAHLSVLCSAGRRGGLFGDHAGRAPGRGVARYSATD